MPDREDEYESWVPGVKAAIAAEVEMGRDGESGTTGAGGSGKEDNRWVDLRRSGGSNDSARPSDPCEEPCEASGNKAEEEARCEVEASLLKEEMGGEPRM